MTSPCPYCATPVPHPKRDLFLAVLAVPLSIAPVFILIFSIKGQLLSGALQVALAFLLIALAALAVLGVGLIAGLVIALFKFWWGHNVGCLARTVREGATFPFYLLREIFSHS